MSKCTKENCPYQHDRVPEECDIEDCPFRTERSAWEKAPFDPMFFLILTLLSMSNEQIDEVLSRANEFLKKYEEFLEKYLEKYEELGEKEDGNG